MALKSELMACGMPGAQAHRLGFDPPANFSAAGSSINNATLLTSNHAIVTPTGASQGVQIGDAIQMWFVQNQSSGAQTISVYPPTGDNFSGLTTNTALSVPTGKAVLIEPGGPTGITWGVSA